MMKKLTLIVMALSVLGIMMAGCSGGDAPADANKDKMDTAKDGGAKDGGEKK